MGQFTLTWDNTAVLANTNAVSQRAAYRGKTAGGAFLFVTFIPPNPLAKSVTTVDSQILGNNIIYEFKVQTICTTGGPTDNDNGIKEMIAFVCITPSLTNTHNSSQISIGLTGTDIYKLRFSLRRSSDSIYIAEKVIVNRIENSATLLVEGLTPVTNYYWEVEMYATIDNVEVISSALGHIGAVCGPHAFTTSIAPVCDPITAITVTSIQI